ncbi:MAG: hypothetical protein JSV86_07090 [Gemmatimonadota bacterium]|nr:MAG: hypothetical protein JSV86_07090 [Gemmatimonadota bacterium]
MGTGIIGANRDFLPRVGALLNCLPEGPRAQVGISLSVSRYSLSRVAKRIWVVATAF